MGSKPSRNIVILLIAIFLLTPLTGCFGQKLDFQASEFSGNDLIPGSFTTQTLTTSQFSLHIQDSLFEKETAQELYNQVLADYTALSTLLQADRHLDIYILEDSLVDDVLLDGTSIYCNVKDVEKGDYQTALVTAYTDFNLPWKLAGVEGAAFGDEIDVNELREYYSDEANFGPLSFFPAYFYGVYTDHNTLSIARDTAASLVQFIVAEQGPNALYQTVYQMDYRQAWLESIGVNATYQPIYDLGFLDDMEYSSTEDFPLIFTSANRTYSFSDNFAESPKPMMYLISNFHAGMVNLMAYLEENTPGYYTQIKQTWDSPIHYFFDGDLGGSYSEPSNASLYFPNAHLQGVIIGTINYLVPEVTGETQIWKNIGLGEYLFSMADVADIDYYNYFITPAEDLTGNNALFHTAMQEYYFSKAGNPANLEDFDDGLLYEAIAVVALNNPLLDIEYPRMATWSIAAYTNQENKYLAYPGNSLTYPEAYLFTKYLVETYSLDKMLDYCSFTSAAAFEDSFGLSYYGAYVDFLEAYNIGN